MMDVERSNSFYFFQNMESPSMPAPSQPELLTTQLREAVEAASAPDSCFDGCINPPVSEYDYGYFSPSGPSSVESVAKKDLAAVVARILDHRENDYTKVGSRAEHCLFGPNGVSAESPDASEDMVMPAHPRKRDCPEEGEECRDSGDSGVFMCDRSKRFKQSDIASKSESFEDRAFTKVEMASLGDANAPIPKSIIEPRYARVNVHTIPAKEARRVLNNRKSAHKSYLRKKEKMKAMEEQIAKYECKFQQVSRQVTRLLSEYEKVTAENRQLKNHLSELQHSNSKSAVQPSLW